MKKKLIYCVVFLIVIFVDQISKWWAELAGYSISLNTGVSFSLFSQFSFVFHLILFLVVSVVMYRMIKSSTQQMQVWYVVLVSAGFSNLIDRAIYGGVRDFLPVPFTTIQNNLADWAILIAVLMLFWGTVSSPER